MKLPGYVIQIILTLLFFVGAAARFSATDESTTPYFKGASAMNDRHAMEVADGGELDRLTNKAAWPEGYKPARYRASGVEYAAGYAFRAIRYFGEVDGRRFIRRLVVFLFSLCVVTLYVFTKNLWDCQAAGLIAAFFVAVFPPLVAATNGREFSHVPFGVFLATVHLALLLHHRRRHSLVPGVLSAVVAFLMLAVWELAPYYVAACALYITLAGGYSHGERTWLATGHALALVAASFALPHLEALSMIACWPTLLAVSCAGVAATGNRLGSFWKRAAVIAGACVALTVALTPVRLGATENIPVLRYLFYRMRFLTGPPESPQLIPDSIRGLWSAAHAPPSTHTLITFFLPLCMLAAAALVYARSKDVDRRKLATTFAVAVLGALVWCVDRSTTVVATVAILPCVAVAGRGVSSALFPRGLLIAGGAAFALLDLVFPLSAGNPAFAIARARGVAGRDPHRFVWVSTVNTDLELVRFVSTRTSTRDPMLGPSDVTALLLAFSGRTSVALTGALSEGATARNARLESLFYGDEAQMQRECTEMGVSYVLYSVDYLLDTSRYSRRYLAGYSSIDPAAVIWKMHFAPHELEHFVDRVG
ncbi:MAG: hypothetical protein IH969_03985, partial [Candidatus Krumholzibacteriota bacterium]|nr:hypothetical protein [Candidatus Krumholzibacteriota bacterium]